ncbi:DnaD domain-containing protein [Caldibacillus thermolactis]|jgi:DNA replication protein|uniref:DnaD domain-containing protein n=1 Tax=Pallidibacillus thermolactis TaxID=251051 RepID=A0ABT2WDX7_9BACI|nr:DnaD domain-containing protein [Pallidibacillus thermolactis]MCU9593666.1 DnaD domain-containing protein [Pallidibacillus thermolactis]MCU9599834.1 DnaD domain-containing protein [Pallidibacillus thermolactis subsp. kokeshiiformis]MED1673861.1 DnaD domain-containing protein [Pallidibacillus thermolactis subsp. kokeshiiformis]
MDKKMFLSWIEEGVVPIPSFLFTYYKKIGLTDLECMVLLHIYTFIKKGNDFPTHVEIAERMCISTEKCAQLIGSLVQRGYLQIINGKTADDIYFEKYSLQPLWSRLLDEHILNEKGEIQAQKKEDEGNVFTMFEQEFARPLSPIEIETITMWLDNDHHEPSLIKAALKEAVMSGKLNFRYIDRILFEWKKNGIKTVEQAQEHGRKFRIHQQQKRNLDEPRKRTDSIPFYNWLEN